MRWTCNTIKPRKSPKDFEFFYRPLREGVPTTLGYGLDRLFEQLKKDTEANLTLVELIANNSPLANSCGIKLYHSDSSSIGPSLRHFESKVGKLTASLDAIDSIKVLYEKKRVSLIFEKLEGRDDEFVVRYSDHRLNPRERIEFELYMASTHAIQVLSTEKRFKQVS